MDFEHPLLKAAEAALMNSHGIGNGEGDAEPPSPSPSSPPPSREPKTSPELASARNRFQEISGRLWSRETETTQPPSSNLLSFLARAPKSSQVVMEEKGLPAEAAFLRGVCAVGAALLSEEASSTESLVKLINGGQETFAQIAVLVFPKKAPACFSNENENESEYLTKAKTTRTAIILI